MAPRRIHWPALALILIVLLAATLRFWRLDSLPPGLYHDEAYYGLDALSLRQGKLFPQYYEGWELYAQDAHANRPAIPTRFPVFFEGNYGREPLHVYLVALSIGLFGPTSFAIRAVAAFTGTLAVLTTFLAARSLFPPDEERVFAGELLPLFAAFTLAVLYPALTFSRFGIRAMTMVPCVTLAVYAFWRGYRSARQRSYFWFALAGFFVGLSLYTFASARLFPFVFMLFGVYWFIADRAGMMGRLRELSLALVVALVTAAPLLLYFARYPYFLVFRIAYVANRGVGAVEGAPLQTWLMNISRVVLGLFWRGETHLRHNLPGRPYLDPLQAGLLAVGAWHGIRKRRRPEHTFLFIWFLVMLLPSILSGDAPHFGRLIGAAAPAAILVAVGADRLVGNIARASWRSWPAILLVALLCAGSLAMTLRDYFGRYAAQPDLARDFYLDDWEMGRFAALQSPGTTLYLTPTQEEMATIYFALADPDRLRSYSGEEDVLPAGIIGHPTLYLVRPDAERASAALQDNFPTGNWGEARPGFRPFAVAAEAVKPDTASAEGANFGDVVRLLHYTIDQESGNLSIRLVWQAQHSPEENYTAFVHLLNEDGTLVAQVDRPPSGFPTSEWQPGEVVVDTLKMPLPDDLAPGRYALQTGFYYFPTLERLGEAASLGDLRIGEP